MKTPARPREHFVLRVTKSGYRISPESGRRFPYPLRVCRRYALQLVACGQIDRGVFWRGKWRAFCREAEALGATWTLSRYTPVASEIRFGVFR